MVDDIVSDVIRLEIELYKMESMNMSPTYRILKEYVNKKFPKLDVRKTLDNCIDLGTINAIGFSHEDNDFIYGLVENSKIFIRKIAIEMKEISYIETILV